MRVAVLGQGYVGLTASAALAVDGHQVVGVERDLARLSTLRQGRCPVREPGLQQALVAAGAAGLTFEAYLLDVAEPVDAVVIAVATPPLPSGAADLSQVEMALQESLALSPLPRLILLKSSIPPGTSASWARRPELWDALRCRYVYSPEFLSQGTAVADWRQPSRVVAGLWDRQPLPLAGELLAGRSGPWVVTSPTNAEMIKYACNTFLATKISFVNEMAGLCEAVGADIDAMVAGVAHDPRIGDQFWRPGLGFGDSCLPKDLRAIIYCGQLNGRPMPLAEAVRSVNDAQRATVVNRLARLVGHLPELRVAVLGLAYEPDSDDVREAPSRDIVPQLLPLAREVRVWDPTVGRAEVEAAYPGVRWTDSLVSAVDGAHAALVLTEYPDLIGADWAALGGLLAEPRVLLDGKNCIQPAAAIAGGIAYQGIGRPSPAGTADRSRHVT